MNFRPYRLLAALVLAGGLIAGSWWAAMRERAPTPEPASKPTLAMMTSLPLYWGEARSFDALLADPPQMPWARSAIERNFTLVMVDSLVPAEGESAPLEGIDRLAIIQPRALAPADNVALDRWVRDGGKLFYAIDPMLTGAYDAPLGSPDHPASVALVPPVLAHWGLGLSFDPDQPSDVRLALVGRQKIPTMLAGKLKLVGKNASPCRVSSGGLLAECRLGKGRATIFADAFLFELTAPSAEEVAGLDALFGRSFR